MNERYIRILKEVYESETRAEIEETMAHLDDYDFEPSDEFKKKMNRLSKRTALKQRLRTIKRYAACLTAMLIVGSAGAMSVSAVRENVVKFVTSVFYDHNEISPSESADATENFTTITLKVPENFALVNETFENNALYREYMESEKFIFVRQVLSSSYRASYDTEHTVVETFIDEDGSEYTILNHNSGISYTVIWCYDQYTFEIHSNLTKEEILDLCKT